MAPDSERYRDQVRLLLRVLPLVAVEKCFALKGGTAINLFVRDLPRLSVDIDLVYLPMDNRDTALPAIHAALERIAAAITTTLKGARVQKSFEQQHDALRLVVRHNKAQIKIELSPVLRGSVFPDQVMGVRPIVEEQFGYAEIQVVSMPDLYAGKLCAALDRQHPRDLFDVKFLLENEGITDDLRRTFLVYLISHSRQIAELISPVRKNITGLYEGEFRAMAQVDVPLADLEAARATLVAAINTNLTTDERRFLVSFKKRAPDWSLLPLPHIKDLPAVRWKLMNLAKMSDDKHLAAANSLEALLFPPI